DFTLALADYNKAAELKNDVSSIFLNRGRTHYNLKSYDQSVADYDRAIELNPRDAAAFYSRGESYERIGNKEKALADYQKASDLDTESEVAKASVKRLQDEIAKATAKPEPVRQVPAVVPPPDFLNLGNLTSANATRMVTPTYPLTAQRTGIEGRVTVEVELDVEGKVVSAKATSGHQMLRSAAEDAAKRSRFNPATFNGLAIKAKGVIQYNFNLKAGK
ncbi:MAG: TonB family protein, partial [Blastocatellia bacterium]